MTTTTAAAAVVLGGALGSVTRHLLGLWVTGLVRHRRLGSLPWGTFVVNMTGCLVLGVVAAAVSGGAPTWLLTTVGTGFCGALTTFSTFGMESVTLLEGGRPEAAAATLVGSLVLGLLVCTAGWQLGAALG